MIGYADADELTEAIGQNAFLIRKPFDLVAVQQTLAFSASRLP